MTPMLAAIYDHNGVYRLWLHPENGVRRLAPTKCRFRNLPNDTGRAWLNMKGEVHRLHGPAVEYDDGSKQWAYHGQAFRRRLDDYLTWWPS